MTKAAHFLAKRVEHWTGEVLPKSKEPDADRCWRLLRAGSEGPRHGRAPEQRDESSPFHSMTWLFLSPRGVAAGADGMVQA